MLKIPDYQVAGHHAHDGLLGPMVDDAGHFFKPCQNDKRGSKELTFYTSLAADTRIPDHICRYFPEFRGTKVIEASNGSGLHPHLVLQDITSSYTYPSIIDLKIGSRTWCPEAGEDYIQKCLKIVKRQVYLWDLGYLDCKYLEAKIPDYGSPIGGIFI